jgi:serine/threonine protein kinase
MSCDFSKEENPFSFGQPSDGSSAAEAAEQTFANTPGFIPFLEFIKIYRFDDKVEPHGFGTFGKIYLGVNQETGLPVAVKKIYSRPTPKNPICSFEAIIKEATTAMLFDSPHLCKVYGFSVDDAGFVYIVMEQIQQGIDAFDYFGENQLLGMLDPNFAKRIFLDIARGLSTLHEAGFAHRDIKLDNVMLEFDSKGNFIRAVIIDFGFTMIVREIPPGSQQGSMFYCAPEIIQRGSLSERVDTWAFGVMLFLSLHSYYPIWSNKKDPRAEAIEVYQKLQKLSKSPEFPPYTGDDKDVNDLYMICARCLEFDQSARISAEELLAMLS